MNSNSTVDDIDRSRRRVLRVGAQATALLAGAELAADGVGTAAATPTETSDCIDALELSVATQNLGLGADFLSIARPDGETSIPERVGELYATVRATDPRARMRGLADVLARERPDVLALQEAALVRRGPRSGNDPADPDAGTVVYDFLGTLREALAERDVPYRPAAITANADLEFPARLDGGSIDVRLTDRDAVLVRDGADIDVAETIYGTFEASLTLPLGGDRTVEIDRGYAGATLRVGDESVDVVSTHLESGLESVRTAQARELAAALEAGDGPLVVAGDLNDGPARRSSTAGEDGATATGDDGSSDDPDAYAVLSASLSDPVGDGLAGAGGTCCRPASLAPPDEDGLSRRIDHVLVDGLGASRSRRLGDEPFGPDGERLWVSDHAGVLVELSATASAGTARRTSASENTASTARPPASTTAATPDESATGSGHGETTTSTPGFGVASAAVALLALGAGAASAFRDRAER